MLQYQYLSRAKQLEQYQILDTASEPAFDRLTQLASLICNAPVALITILTDERQWFKSKVGIDIDGTPIEYSFCNHAIRQADIFEITDTTADERFAENPYVKGDFHVRFYAACPLIDRSGFALGTLCVIDTEARQLSEEQRNALRLLGEEAMELIRMRAQRNIYQEFFELAPEMFCMIDAEGRFIHINSAWEKALNHKVQEIIGKNILSFIHPDDITSTKAVLNTLLEGKTISGFVNRYRTFQGSYRSLQWNARAVNGLIFAASKDITAELKAVESLQRSEERYRTLTELVSDYVYLSSIEDGTPRIEWISDNVQTVLGYTLEEIANAETWKKIVHPEDAEKILKNTYAPQIGLNKVIEYRILAKSGQVRWLRDHHRALEFSNDKKIYIIGAIKDITNEKKAEIALLHAKDLLEKTGEAARIGTWELDVVHQKLIWSDITRVLHEVSPDFKPDVATAINFYKEGESRQKIAQAVKKAIQEGIPYDLELELVTAKQRVIWVRTIGIPEWQNGRCVRLYGAFQDIDEQKRIQVALQQSEQALLERNQQLEQLINLTKRQNARLKEYTYITSHNLRSSVANILSLSDLLYNTPNDLELLNMLQVVTRQLDSTIFKMNTLLNVDSMAETNEKESVNLLDAIRENLALLRSHHMDNVQISISASPQLTVFALPAYIDSILYNLLSNAIKYSRPDCPCQVSVQAYEEDEFVVISVADNGIGIDLMRDGDKLFRMSSRLHTDKEGKGLGLFLVKHQIETMGGRIEVESKLGEGSVFRVYLPKT